MKDDKQMENKVLGIGGLRFGDKKKEAPQDNKEESKENPEEQESDEAPAWQDLVLDKLGIDDPSLISAAKDEELLDIKGVGKKTLAEIREVFPENKPRKKAPKGQVMVRIRPMRGIGGYGQAGWEGPMDQEKADQYAADGYVEILED